MAVENSSGNVVAGDSSSAETNAEKSSQDGHPMPNPEKDGDKTQYPGGLALAAIMLSVYLAVFLVALVSIKFIYHNPLVPSPLIHLI